MAWHVWSWVELACVFYDMSMMREWLAASGIWLVEREQHLLGRFEENS
jgi:hypothetical protein